MENYKEERELKLMHQKKIDQAAAGSPEAKRYIKEEITKILINNGWAISLIETKEYIEDPNSLSPNTMVVIGKKI